MDNASEMLNQMILDSVSHHIAVLDREGTINLVNRAWARFAQENGDASLKHTGVGANYLAVCRRVKGAERKIALAALAGIEAVLAGKQQQFSTLEYPCHSTEVERWFLLYVTPMPKEIGGAVVSHINVTERKQLEEQNKQQDRLEVVGQLAAGIAHDFNNILSVITLYTQLLLKSTSIDLTDSKRVQVINNQAYRAALLLAQITDFSHHSTIERRPLEVQTFLIPLTNRLQQTLPENVQLTLNCEQHEFLVNADPTRLEKVFINLAINARDAMPDGGDLHIEVASLTIAANQSLPVRDITPGEWIRITFSDTGMGISPETIPHIFEPFFSTKGPNQGTGLGLAQTYSIIQRHDGFINVVSRINQGTSFTIYLPALILPEVEALTALLIGPIMGRGEMILVVEDDQSTAQATADILKSLNYAVITATNGKDAIRLFTKHAETIALVLSDLIMPGMDGVSLYQRLLKKQPNVKMILMTRSSAKIDHQTLKDLGIIDYVAKPFAPGQIALVLHSALENQ